jgi:hypothetical protein
VIAGVVDEFGNHLVEITVRGVAPAPVAEPPAPARARRTRARGAEPVVERAPPEPVPARPRAVVASPEPSPSRPEGRPLYRSWPLWAGLATSAAAAGAYFVWDVGRAADEAAAIVADSGSYSYDDLVAVEDRGRRSALIANVCIGAAAGLAVTSVVMALVPHDRDTRAGTALVPRVHVRGRGVALGWEF